MEIRSSLVCSHDDLQEKCIIDWRVAWDCVDLTAWESSADNNSDVLASVSRTGIAVTFWKKSKIEKSVTYNAIPRQ